jgi:uncharacterized protein YgiM (DUF1202 family)
MGRRSNGILFVIIVSLAFVIFVLRVLEYEIVYFFGDLVKAVFSAITALFLFIANNILVIALGILVILSIIILLRNKKRSKSTVTLPRPIKMKIQTPPKAIHPLQEIFSNILGRYGISILYDTQQCRGLLKDYAKNEYILEIQMLFVLLSSGIPTQLINLKGLNYSTNIVNMVYRKNYCNFRDIVLYKEAIEMLLSVLNERGLLNADVRGDAEKPINKIKMSIKCSMPFFKYYLWIFFFGVKNNYKLILPTFLLISATILIFISINNNWRIFNNISFEEHKRPEQIIVEPIMTYAFVNTFSLNMQAYPSTAGPVITQLQQNDKVEILTLAGSWAFVLFNSYKGYVNTSYLSANPIKSNTYAFVSSFSLNMRTNPSTAGSIITQLQQNDKVEILSVADSWSLVLFNNYRGYVNSTYLSDKPITIQVQKISEQLNSDVPMKLDLLEREVKEKE